MTAEEALLNALQELNYLMTPGREDSGSGVAMGMQDFLKKHDCKLVTYLGQVLKSEGLIKQVKQGKTSILFWNVDSIPSLKMATMLMQKTRDLKNKKKPTTTQYVAPTAVGKTIEPEVTDEVVEKLEDAMQESMKSVVIRGLLETARKERDDLRKQLEKREVLIEYLQDLV